MKHYRYILYGLVMGLCMSCGPQMGPQTPANRASTQQVKADSSMMALLEVNKRLAAEAEREVSARVQADTAHEYALCEEGAWLCRTHRTQEGPHPKTSDIWQIHMLVKTMQGELLQDIEGPITIGRGDIPLGIEMAMRQMYSGEDAIIIAPWYAAWGVQGTDNIQPYSNLYIELHIQQ